MEYRLDIRTDTIHDEDGNAYTVYGLDVTDDRGAVLAFPDISFDKEVVLRLMQDCVRERIALCHLGDVVCDTITAQYLT